MVRIIQENGAINTQYFTLEDGAVLLEPDVRKNFPTSESVNKALRSLIEIMPKQPVKRNTASKTSKKQYQA